MKKICIKNTTYKLSPLVIAISLISQLTHALPSEEQPKVEAKSTDVLELPTATVTANLLEADAKNIATATSILPAENIVQQSSSTLGNVLENEMGISADTFGQGASRPIIRGQKAPRVSVMHNGIGIHDASHISPDHQVTLPIINAKKIEVIKGSSALLYGGGAVGGVVNVVDNTPIKTLNKLNQANKSVTGHVGVMSKQATNGYMAHGNVTGKVGKHVLVGAHVQKADDGNIHVPHWDSEDIDNSWYEQSNAGINVAYVNEQDYISANINQITSEYGLPAHVHNSCTVDGNNKNKLSCGAHGHHGHDHSSHDHAHEHGTPPYVDLNSNIIQVSAKKAKPFAYVDSITVKASHTDYQHDEFDEGKIGTIFKNDAVSALVHAKHSEINTNYGKVTGVIGLDYANSDFSAKGMEDYLPETNTQKIGAFVVERLNFGGHSQALPNSHSHTHSHSNTHSHSHAQSHTDLHPSKDSHSNKAKANYVQFGLRQDFQTIQDNDNDKNEDHTALSASIEGGLAVAKFGQLSARISHSQRMPVAQELYAKGAHIATNTWERGNANLNKERTTGIELGYAYDDFDQFFGKVSVYYNHTQDYIYAKTQDMVTQGESAGLRLIDYSQTDAEQYGSEINARYYLNDTVSFGGFGDISIIKINDGKDYAPRLVAPRVGGDIRVDYDNINLSLLGYHRLQQNNVAEFETKTPSYNKLNLKAVYETDYINGLSATMQVTNLLNELAYNHASYLVEQVPMPKRSINFGLNYKF